MLNIQLARKYARAIFEIAEEEKKLWYSKFYDLPLEGILEEDREALDHMMDPSEAIPITRVLDFLKVKDEKETVENGYCIAPDGNIYMKKAA